MKKRLLAVFAHPDDESFGPGGALAKYSHEGVEVHILCATRGEAGIWQQIANKKKDSLAITDKVNIEHVREKELLNSAKVLGIKNVQFLDFIDGTLCNANYHELAKKIIAKINSFKPQVLLTLERRGISGHIDHIVTSFVTTYSYHQTQYSKKLYYLCLPQKWYDRRMQEYFVYFPEGYSEKEITTRIEYGKYWNIRKKAMLQHLSQSSDVEALTARFKKWPKVDHFILQHYRGIEVKFPETDLFEGIR
jgi:LmbE family N-acetylglucosaminyl deacetylase